MLQNKACLNSLWTSMVEKIVLITKRTWHKMLSWRPYHFLLKGRELQLWFIMLHKGELIKKYAFSQKVDLICFSNLQLQSLVMMVKEELKLTISAWEDNKFQMNYLKMVKMKEPLTLIEEYLIELWKHLLTKLIELFCVLTEICQWNNINS